ncbi:hypothetical protein EDB89DRAFT_1909696 [Lactarius sanguifluus]|nr:hypothetical protein EDB89DRAFT_1916643 [Lactarius sanguifluus]KAH9167951.1 hypothetical protein EDB89DRAFT_1909696 [Lactarius sanguifluus]
MCIIGGAYFRQIGALYNHAHYRGDIFQPNVSLVYGGFIPLEDQAAVVSARTMLSLSLVSDSTTQFLGPAPQGLAQIPRLVPRYSNCDPRIRGKCDLYPPQYRAQRGGIFLSNGGHIIWHIFVTFMPCIIIYIILEIRRALGPPHWVLLTSIVTLYVHV